MCMNKDGRPPVRLTSCMSTWPYVDKMVELLLYEAAVLYDVTPTLLLLLYPFTLSHTMP